MATPNRFPVHALKFKDSPYNPTEDEWVISQESNIESLANEIVNGTNTCYLVSGYRGVGKTSFILQVKERVNQLLASNTYTASTSGTANTIPECLFVVTNFAKYENQKSLLKRMIRDVYQVYINPPKGAVKRVKDAAEIKKEKAFRAMIEDLYQRTFQDIKTQLTHTRSSETKISAESKVSDKLLKLLLPVLQLLISAGGSFYCFNQSISFAPVIAGIGFVVWFVFSLINVSISYNRTFSQENKRVAADIYDDEIADFKFQELLNSFEDANYRVVFVLDELDKVEAAQLDNLIKEMKPYLLSGKAHFIIVAGQELAYRYLWAYSGDDAVIGSLFSKFYHIPLFSTDDLVTIGGNLLNTDKSPPQTPGELFPLFNFLIFKSRRVPRSFIARFRQMVTWDVNENKERVPYIRAPDPQEIDLQVRALEIIKEIERISITPKRHEPVLHDYLITQLFINAQQMIFKKDFLQSAREYLDHYQASAELADKAYYQIVAEILTDLFVRMKQAGIIHESEQKVAEQQAVVRENETVSGTRTSPDPLAGTVAFTSSDSEELKKFRMEWLSLTSGLSVFIEDEITPNPNVKVPSTTYERLLYFSNKQAISFAPVSQQSFIDLINNTEPFFNDDNKLRNFKNQLVGYAINPIGFLRQLTEFLLKREIQLGLGTSYVPQMITGFDAAFCSDWATFPDVLIDFRHSETADSDRSDLGNLVEKLSAYNTLTSKGNTLPVVETFFNTNNTINEDFLKQSFNTEVENLNPPYYNKIRYIPVSVRMESGKLKALAERCINQLASYSEFSVDERLDQKKMSIPSIQEYDIDDPQKHLWGGTAEMNERKLSAEIMPSPRRGQFVVILTVSGTPAKPLKGFVYFLLHPTFPEDVYKLLAKDNKVTLKLDAYEAFTVGAVCDEGVTELEVDLNMLENVPKEFRYPVLKVNSPATSNPSPKSKSVRTRFKK